eukprot:scaffold63506_cov20-Tisochrysis_lutea.AAC.2
MSIMGRVHAGQQRVYTHTYRFHALARGFVHYPSYEVWRANSAFPSVEALHAYEQALEKAGALDDALE